MTENIIQTSNLRKTFQMGDSAVHALAGVDLEIDRGSFTVIMGPSGSGKSTLLYLLGGLDRPTSGKISINAQSIESLDENQLAVFRRTTVGFIFQSFNLVPSMTALQNVIFPMRFSGSEIRQRKQKAAELLTRVGLGDRQEHRPSELSGGQQQRVAVARSLVNDPKIILADEPTGNLDTHSGASIMQLLADLHHSGRTIVVVSHDPRMSAFSTHQVFILDGKIVTQQEYQQFSTTTTLMAGNL